MRSPGIQSLSRVMRFYSRTAAFFLSQDTVETNLYCFIAICIVLYTYIIYIYIIKTIQIWLVQKAIENAAGPVMNS